MTMTINPGMLLFCILDSCIAFFFVYFITRSKFGGVKKTLARILASILATLVFIVYFAVLIWFNTAHRTVSQAAQNVVYAAPIVLSILMTVLTLLSQKRGNDRRNRRVRGGSRNNRRRRNSGFIINKYFLSYRKDRLRAAKN